MSDSEYEGIHVQCGRCSRWGYTVRVDGEEGIPDGWTTIADTGGRLLLCEAHAIHIRDLSPPLERVARGG